MILCRRLRLRKRCLLPKDRLEFTTQLLHVRTGISFHKNKIHYSRSHCIFSFWSSWRLAGKPINDTHAQTGIYFCTDNNHFPKNSYKVQSYAWEGWSLELQFLNLYLHNCHFLWSSRMSDLQIFYGLWCSLITLILNFDTVN